MRVTPIATAVLLSLVAAAPAAADTHETFRFADPFSDSAPCDGFVNNWEGHDRGQFTNYARDGVVYRQVGHLHSIETDVNSVTGKAVTVRTDIAVVGDADPDGNLTTWKLSGQFNVATFPGEGIVIHDTGMVRFDEGDITAIHGIHDVFDNAEAAFCSALS